jgi:hypothetical protein
MSTRVRASLLFAVFAFSLLGSGCKVLFGPNTDNVVTDPGVQDSVAKTLVDVPFEDPTCQGSGGISDIGTQQVNLIRPSTGFSPLEDFSGFKASGESGLSGNYVSVTIVGVSQFEEKSCFRTAAGSLNCATESQTLVSGGRPLYLCKKNHAYSRDSIEGVALATFSTIETAGRFYTEAATDGKKLDPVWQMVLPKLNVRYKGRASDGSSLSVLEPKTDNAFWSLARGKTASGGGSMVKVISVLPASTAYQAENPVGARGLWELPFVVAHEYGHHVFFGNVPAMQKFYTSQTSIVTEGDDENVPREFRKKLLWHKLSPTAAAATAPARVVNLSETVVALNEAFADLFAEYAVGGSENMRAVPGVCTNREVSNANFSYAGKTFPKALDTNVLTLFLSNSKQPEADFDAQKCAEVSFQDAHYVGAIYAHGFFDLLKDSGTPQVRTNTLVRWAQALDAEIAANEGNLRSFLNTSAFLMAQRVAEAGLTGKLSEKQCAAFSRVFPESRAAFVTELAKLGCTP